MTARSAAQARWLDRFGAFIGNTDRHLGNLSYGFEGGRVGALAPVYDMLPMAYAPLGGGELPTVNFAPALPLPAERGVWLAACAVATRFWDAAAQDGRISAGFRRVCAENAQVLGRLAKFG